ncbi:hypothetical protein KP79_PYT11733 [Mizuhopecten yessoensis]|uniref:Uncharacterized protein n=1 Tax=Mizuhopecten yessoensis TaxID=6573 RepID=A0A210QSF0_MIZYE|nr:hypothetical protein KP79_PYT11733 [Mizuhopecten yessoensis]
MDDDSVDEHCRFGYYENNGEYEESYLSCSSEDYCCGDFMDRSCCVKSEYADKDEDPPTIGLMFGSIAACIMFIVLCACICGKMARRQLPNSDTDQPYTVQTNVNSVDGPTLTSLPNQIQTSGVSSTIQTSTPSGSETRDTFDALPPSYEECIEKNCIQPPPDYHTVSMCINNAYSSSEQNISSNTEQCEHIDSPASSEWV